MIVQFSEVLNNSQTLARFLGYTKNWRVVQGLGFSNYSYFEPFFKRVLNEVSVCLRDLELLSINRAVIFQVNAVEKI